MAQTPVRNSTGGQLAFYKEKQRETKTLNIHQTALSPENREIAEKKLLVWKGTQTRYKFSRKEEEIAEWVSQIVQKPIKAQTPQELSAAFCNGKMLCECVAILQPGTIKVMPEDPEDRANLFLEGCEKIGVPKTQLFHPHDLVYQRNMVLVMYCIYALAEVCHNKRIVPFFTGTQEERKKERAKWKIRAKNNLTEGFEGMKTHFPRKIFKGWKETRLTVQIKNQMDAGIGTGLPPTITQEDSEPTVHVDTIPDVIVSNKPVSEVRVHFADDLTSTSPTVNVSLREPQEPIVLREPTSITPIIREDDKFNPRISSMEEPDKLSPIVMREDTLIPNIYTETKTIPTIDISDRDFPRISRNELIYPRIAEEFPETVITPNVYSENVIVPRIQRDERLTPNISVDLRTGPRISTDERNSPNISEDERVSIRVSKHPRISPNITVDEKNAPRIIGENQFTPNIHVDERNTPKISKDSRIAPTIAVDGRNSPKIIGEHQFTPNIHVDERNNPKISMEENIAPNISRNSESTIKVNGKSISEPIILREPVMVNTQEETDPVIIKKPPKAPRVQVTAPIVQSVRIITTAIQSLSENVKKSVQLKSDWREVTMTKICLVWLFLVSVWTWSWSVNNQNLL